MGSCATLYFDDFNVWDYKTAVPFPALLFFTEQDLCIGEQLTDDRTFKTYKFITSADFAKHRLNNRGLDLFTCRKLFSEFRTDELFPRHFKIQNPVDYDRYLAALRRIYANKNHRYFTSLAYDPEQWGDDYDVECIIEEVLFKDDALIYYEDIIHCVFLRSLLEVVPEKAPVILDFSELVRSGYIEEKMLSSLFDHYMKHILRKIELDYKIYGFVIENDPSLLTRLRSRIIELNEKQFVNHVLLPLFQRIGYEHVRKVTFHGPGEFGSDILPFRYITPLGTLEYYSVQAKTCDIHGTSSKSGNVGELISQIAQAFAVDFVDDLDNERKRIDKFIIATNKTITASARRVIEGAAESKRKLVFLDIDRIVELVRKHRLLQYLLFSDLG